MTLSITHPYVSAVTDDGDANEVGPSEWNADHSIVGILDAAQFPALTGDITTAAASVATTLATVNANVGTFGSATAASQVTVNGKGLVTAAADVTVTPAASSITGAGDLTRVDDTNVTLTLGGTPTGALLKATSITVGWAGTLAAARLNANVVQSVVNDTNVTGSIAAQALTLGWTGTLAASRGGTGLSALGAGIADWLGVPSSANLAAALTDETGSGAAVFATSPSLVTPLLGTPTSGTLTNCTGLPVSSGLSGLGTGVADWLATPSSTNLAAAVTGETGSGALVFGTSPTIATPDINAGTADSLTGLSVRNTAAAFDLSIVSTDATMAANRSLTIDTVNASRTVQLAGNLAFSGGITTSGSTGLLTFTYGAAISVAFGSSGGTVIYAGNNLSDLTNASTARTNLGLGSMAVQASTGVSISGGTITGITDLTVADGGTGLSATTAYAVLCGGTTSTAALQSVASVGTSGQVLTSNGAGALPTFQTPAGGEGADAWADLNGTGTIALRDSFNMDAPTDNGTGDYTFTFTTDFAAANYAVVANAVVDISNGGFVFLPRTTKTAAAIRIICTNAGLTAADCEYVSLVAFGDQ